LIRAWAAQAGDADASTAERLQVALGEGAGGSLREGPFAIAWTGPAPAQRKGAVCLIDGHVHALGGLRERHGLAPDEPDDAVLALAWKRDGDAALEGLRGDFTIVLWDRDEARGRLVRDPLGARGAFIHGDGRRLILAGEIHSLLPLLATRPAPEPRALMHWVSDRVLRGSGTLFEGVDRLPPAHLLVLGEPGARPRRWWAPPEGRAQVRSAADAADQVREAAGLAVRRRVPEEGAGVLLSGGFDSGSVASLAAGGGSPLPGYSAVFPDHPGMDESDLIQAIGEATGAGGVQMPVRAASALPAAGDYAARFKMPLFSPNLHFMRALMQRAAADGTTVLLDGEGGDEVFGLEPYLMADRLRRGRVISAIGLARRLPGAGDPTPWRLAARALRNYGLVGALPPGVEHAERRRRSRDRGPAKPWLTPAADRLLTDSDRPAEWKRGGLRRSRAHLEDVLLWARDDVGIGQLLRLQAELAGVEGRHPFLHDADLVALMLTLPPELSFDASHDRPLARRAVEGLLPDAVRLRRDKTLFDAFVFSCLTGPDLEPMRRLVGDPSAEINAWVDPEVVRRELIEVDPWRHPRGIHLWATEIWRLATTELWLRS
jgi:asparagine synthase (glutamine-hydrolysing)